MAKKNGGGGGGHGGAAWVITFADLMALLMAFFVMIVSFSTQDTQKISHAAGSIREAFGVTSESRRSGMIERDGLPVRDFAKELGAVEKRALDASFASERKDKFTKQGPENNTHDFERADEEKPKRFLTAVASLRQALSTMPEIGEVSRHVIFEETSEGLNIRLVDQEGRAMFAEGGRSPNEFTRQVLIRIAPVLAKMRHSIRITGHTAGGRRWFGSAGSPWDLSSGRAVAVQEVLALHGISNDRFDAVSGKADSDPLFPGDPFIAANRRVDILLLHREPPGRLDGLK